MTDHNKIQHILQEFCDSRDLKFELKDKKAQMVITYSYEIIEKSEDLNIQYNYWFDVPDRGARIPKFTISITSNKEYPTIVFQKRNLFARLFKGGSVSTKSNFRLAGSTETMIMNLLGSVSRGKIIVHCKTIKFIFNWFPANAQHLTYLRETMLNLEQQLLK